ncbi:3-oxoacyl-ACP synthase [Dickeya dianthicola]|nr:3-oxoacyl-ACP synthase [Dickeya dianthicola]MCI4069963.1 3-oxoacyl-ACP synthase [Dickeya dianthicola]MCI4116690.1 3-oxoacyl-ACP synthase [Dickeya dianthicola]MCI4119816.1 3-oxoacyl-ACP synthase [Dickeya dianthicola]MCI4122687.1 3-oxoacyl-ACP synthase [Dickeya dianthicola]MCI4191425.1 3-oxoacyl-ACP synthase [Dickeya dianthicola]
MKLQLQKKYRYESFVTSFDEGKTMDVYINAVETYLPGPIISNQELGSKIGFKPELIKKLFGNTGRHFAVNMNTGKPIASSAELITIVIKKLLSSSGINKERIDFIIVASATPDTLLPSSVNQACHIMGFRQIETYQIVSGCSGAVQALKLARELVAAPDNGLDNGLVIGVDTAYKFLDIFDEHASKKETKELVNYTLFGDGVGGCLISNQPSASSIEIEHISFKYLGIDEEVGQLANWRGSRNDIEYGALLNEEYKLIEKLVPVITQDTINALTDKLGGRPDWLLPPQLSGSMLEKILSDIGYTVDEIFSLVDKIGNTANAALFFQIKEFSDISLTNERAIGVSVESSRWLAGGLILRNRKGLL